MINFSFTTETFKSRISIAGEKELLEIPEWHDSHVHIFHSNFKLAFNNLLKVLREVKSRYGEYNVAIGIVQVGLGRVYGAQGQYTKAIEELQKGVEIFELIGQVNTREGAMCIDNLGSYCMSVGKFEEAIQHLERAYEIRQYIHKEPNIEVAVSLNNIATCLNQTNQSERAEELYKKSIELGFKVSTVVPEFIETANFIVNLAKLYLFDDKIDLAQKTIERGIKFLKSNGLKNHFSMVNLKVYEAQILSKQKKYEDAMDSLSFAYEIVIHAVGEEHTSTAKIHSNLGIAYLDQGILDQAEKHLTKAKDIYERLFGEEHFLTSETLIGFASLALKRNEPDKAVEYAEKSAEICMEQLGPDHIYTKHSAKKLIDIRKQAEEMVMNDV